jgi:hypothetical protein
LVAAGALVFAPLVGLTGVAGGAEFALAAAPALDSAAGILAASNPWPEPDELDGPPSKLPVPPLGDSTCGIGIFEGEERVVLLKLSVGLVRSPPGGASAGGFQF